MHQGKCLYRSPTRLWQFEPRYRNRGSVSFRLGKWRYTYDDAWVDWDPKNEETALRLQDEEIPPNQYETMQELQKYKRRRAATLEQEQLQRFRQARLDLEQEAQREREMAEDLNKQSHNHHVTEIEQSANANQTPRTTTTPLKAITQLVLSRLKRVWPFLKKYMYPEPAIPPADCPLEFCVAPEDEPLEMRPEQFRKRLSLMELEIEDDCQQKMVQLDYILEISVPHEMRNGGPDI